jgi:carbonic anhydrase
LNRDNEVGKMIDEKLVYVHLNLDSLEGSLGAWYEAHLGAVDHLVEKSKAINAGDVRHLVVECADARVEATSLAEGYALHWNTAGQAITPQTSNAIGGAFSALRTAEVVGHTKCGGCGVRAKIENRNHADLTDNLRALGEVLHSSHSGSNATLIANQLRQTSSLMVSAHVYHLSLGRKLRAKVIPRQEKAQFYNPVVDGWDMQKGQNPRYVLWRPSIQGIRYAAGDFVKGSRLARANQQFDVSGNGFTSIASLEYALSHAMQHSWNPEEGNPDELSFPDTDTLLVVANLSHVDYAKTDIEGRLRNNDAFLEFMTTHIDTGLIGSTYLLLHDDLGQVREVYRVE